jgi:hypothetical protein
MLSNLQSKIIIQISTQRTLFLVSTLNLYKITIYIYSESDLASHFLISHSNLIS